MKDWTTIRERYLRDNLPARLGGLAANLSRINSFTAREISCAAVESMIDESKFFIEWTAPEAEAHVAEALVKLQIQLALWHRSWPRIWSDPSQRSQVAEQSKAWSQQVLEMSGLLKQ